MKRLSYDFTGPDFPVHDGHNNPNVMVFLNAPGNMQMRKSVIDRGDESLSTLTETTYPNGIAYTFDAYDFDGLEDFADLIREAMDWHSSYAVRGAVLAKMSEKSARSHRRDNTNRSLVDTPRSWAMIDVDEVETRFPPDWRNDEVRWLRTVIAEMLPEAFHEAGCIAVYSSKARIDGGKPKLHLFFLFDRPLLSHVVMAWTEGLADTSVLTPSQPHLIARPIVLDAMGNEVPDPFGDDRVVLLNGPPVLTPSEDEMDAIVRSSSLMPDTTSGGGGQSHGKFGWMRFGANFGDTADPNHGLNRVILRMTMSYCRTTPPRERNRELLRAFARSHVEQAKATGRLNRSDDEIERELGPKFDDMYARAEERAAKNWEAVHIRPATPEDHARLEAARALSPSAFTAPIDNPPDSEALKRWSSRSLFRG